MNNNIFLNLLVLALVALVFQTGCGQNGSNGTATANPDKPDKELVRIHATATAAMAHLGFDYSEEEQELISRKLISPCDGIVRRDISQAIKQYQSVLGSLDPIKASLTGEGSKFYVRNERSLQSLKALQNVSNEYCSSRESELQALCFNNGGPKIALLKGHKIETWIQPSQNSQQVLTQTEENGFLSAPPDQFKNKEHFNHLKLGAETSADVITKSECVTQVPVGTQLGASIKEITTALTAAIVKKCTPDILMDAETKKFCQHE